MKAEDVKWCPQHGYPLPCYKCGMPLSQTSQKEIYEAGRKAGYDKALAQLADMTEECKQIGRIEVVEWIPQLIQKIKDAMWNDDWGVKGVIYEDMLDRIVGKGIHDQKKKWGIK